MKVERIALAVLLCAAGGCSLALDWERTDLVPADAAADATADGCAAALDRDPLNCGRCGLRCGANQACAAGRCACEPGWGDCNAPSSDGCEAQLASSATHCGACGRACTGATLCAAGACMGGGCRAPLTTCGMQCVDLLTNPQHCGACGRECARGAPRCCQGACQTRCP